MRPPLQQVLERLQGVKRSGKEWSARCPAHDDRSPSLSVSEGREVVFLSRAAGAA